MVDPLSIALAAAAASGGLSIGTGVATAGAYLLIGGVAVGGSLLLSSLNRPNQHVDNQLTVKQASTPRTRAYGRVLLGGAYFYFASAGWTLYSGYALCQGPIDAIEAHLLNGTPSPIGSALGGPSSMWPWYGQVFLSAQLGTDDQTAQALPGWDADFRLRGIANCVVGCVVPYNPQKNFTKYFPSGAPSYLAQIRGSKVLDPRQPGQSATDSSTWTWSANPALCVMDYLTHPDGMNVPRSRIDLASFGAMADLCDQAVPLGVNGQEQYAPGTLAETRYVLWGTYTLDEAPKTVLDRMLKTCDGELYPLANGTIGLRGGAWTAPTVTITPDMILSCEAHRGVDKLATFNQLRIRYTAISSQFQQVEGDPWDDVAAQEAAGEVLPQDFDIVMVPSYTQGQRLAKIFMAKSNPEWMLTLTTNLAALDALGERTVHVTHPDLSIDEDFFVNGFEIGEDGATCKLTLGALSADDYTWSTEEEGNPAPAQVIATPGPYIPPAPTGLVLSIVRTYISDAGIVPQLQATVTTPADQQLTVHGQYRVTGDTDWIDMSDPSQFVALSGAVSDGVEYDVQMALTSFGGTDGPFITDTITVIADDTAPAPVSGFTVAAGGAGVAELTWTNPSSANFTNMRVYRSTGTDYSVATAIATVYGSPNQAMTYADTGLTAGTYNYWLVARNASTVAAAAVGPNAVTVT